VVQSLLKVEDDREEDKIGARHLWRGNEGVVGEAVVGGKVAEN
jgi:hypothetical protein